MRIAARIAAVLRLRKADESGQTQEPAFVGLESLEPRLLLSATIAGIDLISLAYNGDQGNDDSITPSISADGRFIAFVSAADNLVPDDNNGVVDVFVYDRELDLIERVSVGTGGVEANERSVRPSISADGRYVVFESLATNLDGVVNENNTWDVFIHDRQMGITQQMSVATGGLVGGDGASGEASVSADGRYVVFTSNSTNLVDADNNGVTDVFLHDRLNTTTIRVSLNLDGEDANDASGQPYISNNGQWIVFSSIASDLVADDNNGAGDVFRYEVTSGLIERVTLNALGQEADRASNNATISDDGRFVAFESYATNLAAGDVNNIADVFVKDLDTGEVERASGSLAGTGGNGHSTDARISADGSVVVFHSFASNLVDNDTNNAPDIFAYNRLTQEMMRVSTDAAGNQSMGFAINAAVSGDGNLVVFESDGADLVAGDANNRADIFLAHLTDASVVPSPILGDFSGDGQVNTADINPFILALTNTAAWIDQMRPILGAHLTDAQIIAYADPNGDGLINTADINPFITLLTGGSGSGQSYTTLDATADTTADQTQEAPASAPTTAAPRPAPSVAPTTGWTMTARSLLDVEGETADVLEMLA
jgi:Tol biopolymer transport system component